MHLVKITVPIVFIEILIAELSEASYEAFEEVETGLLAYVPNELYNEDVLLELQQNYSEASFTYTVEVVEQENWNAQWEANYDYVVVADVCLIKSSFHQIERKYPYEILINPKMSFGTGHHETTTLMLEHILELEVAGKRVLDAGCGTGILAILAYQRHAAQVQGFDIDEWPVANALENVTLNNCPNLDIWQGDIQTVPIAEKYDILIANIQRNVLMAEMQHYAARLAPQGILLLSGFYEADVVDLCACAAEYQLKFVSQKMKNNWVALKLQLLS